MNKKSATAGHVVLVAGGTGNVGENIARAFLQNGATVVVPSRSAEKLQKFVKRLGNDASERLLSVAAAGQLMLGRALALELEQSPVRVNELVLGPVMTRARHGRGDPEWVTGEEVGEFVVQLSFGSHAKGQVFRLLQRRDLAAARVEV